MVYKYASKSFPVPAQVVGEALSKIEEKQGELTKRNVLEAARKKSSVLHKCFEWDDEKAAEKYRLHQANQLITSVVLVNDENPSRELHAFVNIGDAKQGRFISINTAFQIKETRDVVLQRALCELQAFKKKYETLSELSQVFAAIDAAVA